MLKRVSPNTDQRLRSLLQKAVRRGHVDLVERVANILYGRKETSWLRSRAVVITYEECWPLASKLVLDTSFLSKLSAFKRVTLTKKDKSAAGLGTLAHALSEGDSSVLNGGEDDRHIKIVAEAIRRPNDFWHWVKIKASTTETNAYFVTSRKYISSPTWPWDKAFVQAATYLAITSGISKITPATPAKDNFPFWVALDKHTPQGKEALKIVAKQLDCPYRQILWTSFYLESARTNISTDSHWWNRELEWRLRKAGLTHDKAKKLWQEAAPLVAAQLDDEAKKLKEAISTIDIDKQTIQNSLI